MFSSLSWAKYHDILRPSPSLFKLLDTPDIKKLGRYILELKQHRENKLQNVNNNLSNIHQHVTNANFQGQGERINMDTHALLGLSLAEPQNKRTTKHGMSGLKASRLDVEAIKKMRKLELHHLEDNHEI